MFKPTRRKVIVTVLLAVLGALAGLSTFGPFEGSVREGAVSAFTEFQREVVRPLTFMGQAVALEKHLSRTLPNELTKWGAPALTGVVVLVYYYVITCVLAAVLQKLRAR